MDFDSIITVLFLIVIFVLPSILKQVQARKKKPAAPRKIKKNPSLLDRIGEPFRQFVRELEEQARRQREESQGQEDFIWDEFAETDADFKEIPPVVSHERSAPEPEMPEPEKIERPEKKRHLRREDVCLRKEDSYLRKPMHPLRGYCRLKSDPLQNAVIWSEILSKPIALRDE